MTSSLLLTAAVILSVGLALADYDHTCGHSDYRTVRPGAERSCRMIIDRIIPQLCGSRGLHITTGVRIYKKRDVHSPQSAGQHVWSNIPKEFSLTEKDAHSMLSAAKRPQPTGNQGFRCECCVNTCKRSELSEYCAPGRRRRRRSSQPQVTQEDIDRFYEQMNSLEYDYSDWADASPEEIMQSYEEFEQQPIIQQLERNKAANIALQRARESGELANFNELANRKAEYSRLPDHLRVALLGLLAKNDTIGHSSEASSHLTADEVADLRRLREMFERQMEGK